jgi:hypothetical protein
MNLINSLYVLGRLVSDIERRMRRCNASKKGKYFPLFQLREKLVFRVMNVECWLQSLIDNGYTCDIMAHDEWMRQLQERFKNLL